MHLSTDEQFLAAVAAALGETIALVRHRGFHLDQPTGDCDQRPARPRTRQRSTNDDDTLDMGSLGIDWDAEYDPRRYRRRRPNGRRVRRRVA